MRLTLEIKRELTKNLLVVSPLYQKVKDTLQSRADLVERIRQACLEQCKTSDEEIASVLKKVKKCGKIESFAYPGVNANRTSTDRSAGISVGINGQHRELDIRGVDRLWDRNRGTHRITDSQYFGKGVAPECVPDRFLPVDRVLLINADKIHDELCASDVAISELFSELEAFNLKVMGALKQINTVKQLQQHWPDAVDYLPDIVKPVKAEVALSVDTLNAICGLPK